VGGNTRDGSTPFSRIGKPPLAGGFLVLCMCGPTALVGDLDRNQAYDPPMNVRSMRPDEIDAAVSVWREANIARGAPHGPERAARVHAKLSAPDALPFVAARPGIVGIALAEPGRFDDGAGGPDPSLLHISMVFVRPGAQRTGVGLPLVLYILDVGRSIGYRRVGVWTARENSAAPGLYERAGMTLTVRTAPLRSSLALQYECPLDSA
jgi:ribosomal protein S18 acetylase RimI-like enzyme